MRYFAFNHSVVNAVISFEDSNKNSFAYFTVFNQLHSFIFLGHFIVTLTLPDASFSNSNFHMLSNIRIRENFEEFQVVFIQSV